MTVHISMRYVYTCDTQGEYERVSSLINARPDITVVEDDAAGLTITTEHELERDI